MGVLEREEIFKNSPLFAGLAEDELSALLPLFKERTLNEGSTLFLENRPGESMYFILSGVVKFSKLFSEGDERALLTLGEGESFGEMALLDGGARSVTATVLQKAKLLSLTRKDFQNLMKDNPAAGCKLMVNIIQNLCKTFRATEEKYMKLILSQNIEPPAEENVIF